MISKLDGETLSAGKQKTDNRVQKKLPVLKRLTIFAMTFGFFGSTWHFLCSSHNLEEYSKLLEPIPIN